jgi:hypothetical protein
MTLHNEELPNLHTSPNIIQVIKSRRMRLGKAQAHMGETRNAHKILDAKPEVRPLRKPWHRWKDNREMWWEGVDWMHPAQDKDQWQAVVNTVMNLRVS